MKSKIRTIVCTIICVSIMCSVTIFGYTGCTEAERASYNISQQADNFNTVRQLTVINCIQGDVLFQMTGKLSISVDVGESQLEITVEDEYGRYKKHFIGLSDNVTYVVEDITDTNDISKYHYTLNFNPNMWIPVDADYID